MSFSAHSTLEKMNSADKDFRYMATRDLVTELEKKNFSMDAESEKRITNGVLKLLEDSSNQVQEMAVKSLGPLIKKSNQTSALIVETLCNHIVSEKKGSDELRDVASLGLKNIISEIPTHAEDPNLALTVIKKTSPKLISGIKEHENNHDIVYVCLEILNDLLGKFGPQMEKEHESILQVVLPQMSSKRATSRKKAIGCLEHLSSTIPDNLFTSLMQFLQKNILESSSESEELRTFIQALGAVSRSVGYRVGKYLSELCPILLKYCDSGDDEGDDDLRESCLQCFEILILRCPKEVSPFLSNIKSLCLKYIKYDPNYVDEGSDMETEEDDEEEDDEEFAEDYSDDDDMSWKVRRASSKCLSAIVQTRPDMLENSYHEIAPTLISRFKEREENVKLDIFATFGEFLNQTSFAVKRNPASASEITKSLREMIPKIVGVLSKQLKDKSVSVKIRSAAFSLLKDLVVVLGGGLEKDVTALIPGIQLALGDKNTSAKLKIEGLVFLRILMQYHPPSAFFSQVDKLAPLINKSIADNYYRTSAGGLKAGCEFVRILRSDGEQFDHKPYVSNFFNANLEKLKVQDIDQEVKESAINCISLIIANLGDELKSQIPEVLKIFVDRLSNEITRLATVRAFETIGASPLKIDLGQSLAPALKEMSTFLRKTNRQLKQSSLITLSVLIQNYGQLNEVVSQLPNVLAEAAPIISDADLHLSHLALSLCVIVLSVQPSLSNQVTSEILPKGMQLLRSPLLQGFALESFLKLLNSFVKIKENESDKVIGDIVAISKQKEIQKHVLLNCAKSVASVALATPSEKCSKTISSLIKDLSQTDDLVKQLALYCLGEIGRNLDLSSYSIHDLLLPNFESPNEETRQAASFALGNIAVGNLDKYLPQVLGYITNNTKSRYLLLHSLREIIVRLSLNQEKIKALHQHQHTILPLLYQNCESDEEGTRNVVSECLGKLALVNPKELIPTLVERAKSNNANTRATIVSSLKFAIVERPHEVDEILLPNMNVFLDLLKDQDLNVRRNTLLTMNYAAHNKPALLRESLRQYIPLLYGESKVKKELIREVDLGPFKYKKDDGLEIRKAAFECMYTLLDTCLDRIDISEFISNLVDALNDHYDIKMLAHLIIIRCSHVAGAALLPNLDQLVEPLRSTVTTKPKEGAVKQEVERNDELIRSALRAIAAITNIPNFESNQKFNEFLRTTVKQDELGKKFASIQSETGPSIVEKSDKMEVS